MAVGALVATLVLSAAAAPSLDADLATELRERTPEPGESSSTATAEWMLAPAIVGRAATGRLTVQAGYAPRLTLVDPGGLNELAVLHAANVDARYALNGRDALTASVWASRGETPISPLQVPTGALVLSPDRLPPVTQLDFEGATARVGAELHGSRRERTRFSVTYLVSGGDSAAARAILPLQQGPRVDGDVEWQASRRDSLDLAAYAQYTGSSGAASANGPAVGVDAEIAQVSGSWLTQLTRFARASLTLGGAAVGSEGGATASETGVLPVAGAELHWGPPERVTSPTASLALSLAPSVDPVVGTIAERSTASLGVELSPREGMRASAGIQGGSTLVGPEGTFGLVSAGLKSVVTRWLSVALSGQVGYFNEGALLNEAGQVLWMVTVGGTVAETGLH